MRPCARHPVDRGGRLRSIERIGHLRFGPAAAPADTVDDLPEPDLVRIHPDNHTAFAADDLRRRPAAATARRRDQGHPVPKSH